MQPITANKLLRRSPIPLKLHVLLLSTLRSTARNRMALFMMFQVGGACRGNGTCFATGAAAACLISPCRTSYTSKTEFLPNDTRPTKQRAQLMAIVIALRWVVHELSAQPFEAKVNIAILSDSTYAINCMESWIRPWSLNGWRNARGSRVANVDLLEEALYLDDNLRVFAQTNYCWMLKGYNTHADRCCNEVLNGDR
ncbi:ribonuclease H-like domain-containing protein [Xylariales sp. PMI_506]|nr:ribonuclease H-like domain-containing protein [Xylariales sp. PMI_506]